MRLRTHTGLAVDLRIVAPDQFGNLLQHFTGSKEHNMALRDAAVRKGLHVSEYGVLDDADRRDPPLRDRGRRCTRCSGSSTSSRSCARTAASSRRPRPARCPELIELGDLRGDLHCHTTASDGTASIEEMAPAARDAGYEYLAITDHSASLGFGDEVSPERLREQIERIRATEVDGIELLAGSEVNILPDGSLDYDDELLAELDWVIASGPLLVPDGRRRDDRRGSCARSSTRWSTRSATCRAARSSGARPTQFDLERGDRGRGARPGRCSRSTRAPTGATSTTIHARAAAAAGVPIVINCDAHRVGGFEVARYGIATARRAWLTARGGREHAAVGRGRGDAAARTG